MAYTHYDRLSALDASFLDLEDENVNMHVASVGIFDAGPLTGPDGALDFERLRAMAGPTLTRSPRFRQRLAQIPLLDHPVWIDDERFNLDYHLRHTALPEPGTERQLKRLAGRILSQKLDRGKPLWEMWFVEGLEGDRFAVISKVHHCMIDGVSGVELLGSLMDPGPEPGAGREEIASHRWLPRPAPGGARLLLDELGRRASLPFALARGAREAVRHPQRSFETAREAVSSVGEMLGAGLDGASPTPLNVGIGPHRRFDWLRIDMEAIKQVRERMGGTLNDVVLCVVAGALRGFLEGRGMRVDDLDLRAQVPVNVRASDQRRKLGNRVAMMLARLPVDEPDLQTRFERVVRTTSELKRSHQVHGGELVEELGDRVGKELLTSLVRLGARGLGFNLTVTNVPGPRFPVYMLGARMLAIYPVVPLFVNQGVGIALFSYDDGLYWGLNADWEAVPDLHDLASALETEFELLRKL
ncbi:MAG: wax ester/triacylglycerol synthase family O-acyltransferase [Myxococcota bacterium]|nr:wax ester/triacylglycerol synthase family O-acyltransferase [Myxococcota bacterium]